MKIMLKRIIVDYCANLWKNVSHLKRLKKTTTTKNKPKIVQNTMTNSCPQSHDDWRFMALLLTGGRTLKKDQVERVRKHAAGIGDKFIEMNGGGWSVLEAITLSAQNRWYEYFVSFINGDSFSNQFHNSWKHCPSCFSSAKLTPFRGTQRRFPPKCIEKTF